MTCENVTLPGGARAIICSSRKRERCKCGRPATLLCDWKVSTKKSGTCDAPICDRCTCQPVDGKDLCPTHRAAWEGWRSARTQDRSEAAA